MDRLHQCAVSAGDQRRIGVNAGDEHRVESFIQFKAQVKDIGRSNRLTTQVLLRHFRQCGKTAYGIYGRAQIVKVTRANRLSLELGKLENEWGTKRQVARQ